MTHTTTRDKIQAQDLILKAIAELASKTSNLAIKGAIEAEYERLAKKWGVA